MSAASTVTICGMFQFAEVNTSCAVRVAPPRVFGVTEKPGANVDPSLAAIVITRPTTVAWSLVVPKSPLIRLARAVATAGRSSPNWTA